MNEFSTDLALKKLEARGFDDFAVELAVSSVEQVRFSRNSEDIYNNWDERYLVIFASRGKRTVSTNVKDPDKLDAGIDTLWELAGKIPENPSYEGINPETQGGKTAKSLKPLEYDLQDLSTELVNSALGSGAERTAGVLYNRAVEVTVGTRHNLCTYTTGGLEAVIRSFKGPYTGQESRHFGLSRRVGPDKIGEIGRQSAEYLAATERNVEVEPRKYHILMSPYVIGNLISYSSGFLSYYSVESGLSCFADSMNKEVSNHSLTLVDDPLDSGGVGYRACDDEGTRTRRTPLIENGMLKNFMHSYSTAVHAGAKTTGNAGILTPGAWQLKMEPGRKPAEKLISEIEEGLFINNCWYTRFQDYRNAVFSTVPRDGVFFVKNGEIKGAVSGIRISDSIPNVLSGVTEISSDIKNVKWWEEISPSSMPYVVSENVNISKGF